MYLPGYDIGKAAQVAAFFALKQGGAINVLKLSKLLYLAERESMKRFDMPMFYDRLASMEHGPVASITLNLINGDNEHPTWSRFIAPRTSYDIAAVNGVTYESLDHLSRADLRVLEDLWQEFGGYDRYALRAWTHKKENVPEWEDPDGGSRPIHHRKVYEVLGKDGTALESDLNDYRNLIDTIAKSA